MIGAVARRYAKALFALTKEVDALQPTADGLARLAAVASDPTVAPVLRSPLLSRERRSDLIQALTRELHLSDLLTRFLQVLGEHQRLGELPAIHECFETLLDAELRRVRVTIRTAQPLQPQQQEQLLATFAQLTGKQVLANTVVDPELLGGVLVEAEGKVYDGSVRRRLEQLAKDLTAIS